MYILKFGNVCKVDFKKNIEQYKRLLKSIVNKKDNYIKRKIIS